MALSGSGTYWARTSTAIFAADTFNNWSVHCFIRSSVAPNNSGYRIFGGIVGNSAQTPHGQMIWDHVSSTYAQSATQRRANNNYDAAKLTSTLSTNTWYGFGGSFDGSNVKAWLNGVNETTTPSAVANATNAMFLSVLGICDSGGNLDSGAQLSNGEMAEYAVWNVALTSDEFVALSKGLRPRSVRPQSLQFYCPMVRQMADIRGNPITEFNSPGTVTDHPRVYG